MRNLRIRHFRDIYFLLIVFNNIFVKGEVATFKIIHVNEY